MIPDETVERVRESADIVGVIGEYVELKRQGADFRGPCPFHQGTDRNFSVSPKKMMYYCFVCHEGGDVFTFLMKRLGVDWPTAVKMVAEKSGIEVVETTSGRSDEKDTREPLWEVNGAAVEYFRQTLWEDDLGRAARAYLEEREISRELAEKVGLGFAPREIGLMRAYLNTLGFDDERLVEVGLLHTPEGSSEPRPRFRDRLIFPIYDVSSRVVGFGGRLLGPGEPKYLNSAESPVFSKGKLLYGLNWAKQAARRDERMLVVEGYFDVDALDRRGHRECRRADGHGAHGGPGEAHSSLHGSRLSALRFGQGRPQGDVPFGRRAARAGRGGAGGHAPRGRGSGHLRAHARRARTRAQITSSIDVFERKIQLLERGGWFGDLRKKRQALDRLLPTLRATSDPLTRDMYLGHAGDRGRRHARAARARAARASSRANRPTSAVRSPGAAAPEPDAAR